MTVAITNRKRVKRCNKALRRYNDEWDPKSNLVDLLADARHWCDHKGLSFAQLDRLAFEHYLAELGEDEGGRQ